MEIHLNCQHEWQLYVAESTPYQFCKKCQSTIFNGKIYYIDGKKQVIDT